MVILVPAALSACLPTPKGPAPRYLGTVTPTIPGPLCPPSRGSAVILEDRVQFAPDEGVWILDGLVDPSGTITADRSRMGANKQPYVTSFEGRWTPTTITGTYKTPKCSYTVDLKS